MKIISLLIGLFFLSPSYAEVYKCIKNGNTSYQQRQCEDEGDELVLPQDISVEKQQEAVQRLEESRAAEAEQRQLDQKAADKERLIRAEEDNANASYQNARANRAVAEETAKQTEALENRNNNDYLPYYNPRLRPGVKPSLPNRPVARPVPLTK